jgi:hypothetical protein
MRAGMPPVKKQTAKIRWENDIGSENDIKRSTRSILYFELSKESANV